MLNRLIGARLSGIYSGSFVQRLWPVVACLAIEAGPAAASSGLPQLNVNTFPTQLFWLAVSFLILYLAMAKIALPSVAAVLDERARKIDGDLQAAFEAKSNAEAALKAYDQALIAARHEGRDLMKSTAEQIALEHSNREQALGQKLAAQNAEAHARISAASKTALANLHQIAAETAVLAVHRLTGLSISHAEASTVVNQLLEERR